MTLTDTPRGVQVVYELPQSVTSLPLGDPESPPPAGSHIRAVEPGLTATGALITGGRPFRRATILLEPDDRDVAAHYPLIAPVPGHGFVVYAPYLVPPGAVTTRVGIGGARSRVVSRSEVDGGFVLVGSRPRSSRSFSAVSSTGAPVGLQELLFTRAEALLRFYQGRLGFAPRKRPVIVVSYSPQAADKDHWRFRGDVTPNGLVLLRFRGPEQQVAASSAMAAYTAFLAHEIFHLWNAPSGDHPVSESWLHEGAADYFSWIAQSKLWPSEVSLASKLNSALNSCMMFLGERPISQTGPAEGPLRYACGAIAQWIVDVGVRSASQGRSDGLSIWSDILGRRKGGNYTITDFRTIAARDAAPTFPLLATFLDRGFMWDDLARTLMRLGSEVSAGPPSAMSLQFVAAKALSQSACGEFGGLGMVGNRLFVTAPDSCELLARNSAIIRTGSFNPATDAPKFYGLMQQACLQGTSVPIEVERGGISRTAEIKCTAHLERAPPQLRIKEPLPTRQ